MSLNEKIARAALEGFFGSQGFVDMQTSAPRRHAVSRVSEVLQQHEDRQFQFQSVQAVYDWLLTVQAMIAMAQAIKESAT